MRPVITSLAFVAAIILSFCSGSANAQMGDPVGPGQPVPRPAAQCPQAMACTYDERTMMPAGYRFQALTVCGANCTTQYWVSAVSDGRQLLEVPPVRGGGLVAVARSADGGGPPAIRTVLPSYGPNDAMCCPSSYVDTTYTWDAAQNTLVPGQPVVTPAGDGDVLATSLDQLTQSGFTEIFGGP